MTLSMSQYPSSLVSQSCHVASAAIGEVVGEGAVTVLDPLGASGEAFDRIVEHFDVPKTAREFARSLVAGPVVCRCSASVPWPSAICRRAGGQGRV